MDNTITVNTFSQVKEMIRNHLKGGFSEEQLSQVKDLFYFNAKGDLKGYDFHYIDKAFLESIIYSYQMEDKSLFQFLLSLSLKFSSSNYEKPLCAKSGSSLGLFFSLLIYEKDNVIIDVFKAIYPTYTESIKYWGWSFHDFFRKLIEQKKYEVLKALFHPEYCESKQLSSVLSMGKTYSYDNGYVMLSPAQCTEVDVNNLINAIAQNDITCLNIFLRANPKLIKKIDFKKLHFVNNEAMTYLKIVRAQGLTHTQEIFKFNLSADLNLTHGEKIKTLIKTMESSTIERLSQGVGKIMNVSQTQERTGGVWLEIIQNKFTQWAAKKAKKPSLIDEHSAKKIKEAHLTKDTINSYFDFIYQSKLAVEEKNRLLELQAVVLNILSVGEMSVKVKCDILLILEDKLPTLTQSYIELIQQDSKQKQIHLDSYLKSIDLIIQQFQVYYEEVQALKTQKLTLTFTEQVVFLEKKYLTQKQ